MSEWHEGRIRSRDWFLLMPNMDVNRYATYFLTIHDESHKQKNRQVGRSYIVPHKNTCPLYSSMVRDCKQPSRQRVSMPFIYRPKHPRDFFCRAQACIMALTSGAIIHPPKPRGNPTRAFIEFADVSQMKDVASRPIKLMKQTVVDSDTRSLIEVRGQRSGDTINKPVLLLAIHPQLAATRWVADLASGQIFYNLMTTPSNNAIYLQ